MNKNFFHKKIITSMILFALVFSLVMPMFLAPQAVLAQATVDPPIVIALGKVVDAIKWVYKKTNDVLRVTGLDKYLNNMAQEAAVAYSSGNKGQKPAFITDPYYYKKVADGAAGDFINNLAKGKMGGVCNVTKGGEELFMAPSSHDPNKADDFIPCKTDAECPAKGVLKVCEHRPEKNCTTDKDCPVIPAEWLGDPLTMEMEQIEDFDNMIKKLKGEGKKIVLIKDDYWIEKVIDKCSPGKGKCLIPGFDICETDLKLRVKLIGGVKEAAFKEHKPECPISKMDAKFKELKSRTKLEDWIDYQSYFNPNANDIGVQLSLTTKLYDKKADAVVTEEKSVTDGTLSTKDLISKKIKTPAWIKNSAFAKAWTKGMDEKPATGSPIADAFKTFTNTFASRYLKMLMEKGFSHDDGNNNNDNNATGSATSIKAAEKIYSSTFTPQIISGGNYDILSEYYTCADPNFAKIDNCVIGQSMASFLRNNEKITFQDAINNSSDYPWINFSVGKDKNNKIFGKGDQDEGFSLANIRKMRKARIVPLGLELAVEKIIQNSEVPSATLKQIVEGFNKTESPFRHLVDPNWILKIPQHQCGAMVAGETLDSAQSNQRSQTCADLKSCLKDDAGGNCEGAYGYCVREKNIWRFNGDSCPDYFNTCQTFQKENQSVSYLKNTLNFSNCDSNNAGCLWYSKEYVKGKELCNKELEECETTKSKTCKTTFETCETTNETKSETCKTTFETCKTTKSETCKTTFETCETTNETDSFLVANRIYFNKNIQTCNVKDEGCHEFIQLSEIKSEENPLIVSAQDVLKEVGKTTTDDYANYATVNKLYLNKNRLQCDAANVGCEKYTPINGEPWIPGIAKSENVCPQECVGYKSYHQLGTNFEAGSSANLIPNGKQCSASETGCDEFTNLDELAKGGEGKEYYTYLRQCVKTNEPTCGVFYTWVGSDTQGFQIKSYNLQKVRADKDAAPKTIGDLAIDLDVCNSEADAINNPECKEFFDEQGNKFYKIYKKTISCSEDCHPLRKTNTVTTELDCTTYGGTWENGQCIFMAIPSEGQTCSAGNVGCRAYRGNQGDNFRVVLQDDFEDSNSTGWENAVISSDASVIGGSSIKSNTTPVANLIQSSEGVMPNLLIQNKIYEISFYAKSGSAITEEVKVEFNDGTNSLSFKAQSISTDWNKYTFGPLLFNRPVGDNEVLQINGNIYLDNFSLKEITDIYLVKNSWNIPASCNQTLAGESQPRAMLGCAGYQNRSGIVNYLKSFYSVCNEKLIGCQALIDTQNSLSPYEQKVKEVITPSDTMAYFINNPLNYCMAEDKGCQSFGLPELDINGEVKKDENDTNKKEIWKDVYLKNNPDQYATLLCLNTDVSCQEYKNEENANDVLYFKDPGDKVCEYRLNLNQDGYGWYKKGTAESICPLVDTDPTKNWARMCDAKYSKCTAFIDPLDTGQPSYFLNNAKINRSFPMVSKKEGKILFNDTSKKGLIYDAKKTYEAEKTAGKAVSPVTCDKDVVGSCTANAIIKVDRDRVCGQWLSCKSSNEILVNGKKKNICSEVGLCGEAEEGSSSGCKGTGWVIAKEGDNCKNDLECLSGKCSSEKCVEIKSLNEENYQARNISWEGLDYSGYAIANQYPIYSLDQKDYSTETIEDNWKLAYGYTKCVKNSDCLSGECIDKKCTKEKIEPISKSCRAYPEATSPFSRSVINQDGFRDGNFCSREEKIDDACECDYTKAETTDYNFAYFSQGKSTITGICTGDGIQEKIGTSCSNDEDCCGVKTGANYKSCKENKKGHCSTVKKSNQYLGWKGYCLENDPDTYIGDKNACLTWYPTDRISGEIDIDQNSPDAGFNPGGTELGFGSGPYYCLEKSGAFKYRTTYDNWYWTWKGFNIFGLIPAIMDWAVGSSDTSECKAYYRIINIGEKTHWYWGQKKVSWQCQPYQGDGCYDTTTNQINDLDSGQCDNAKICNKIVAVSNGSNNKAWTDKIYKKEKISSNNYSDECSPYGALPYGVVFKENYPVYIGNTCAENKTSTGKRTSWLGKYDYEEKLKNLQNIFVESTGGIYRWSQGTKTESKNINICDENSYNKNAICDKKDLNGTIEKNPDGTIKGDNAYCNISGKCEANTCNNGLGQKGADGNYNGKCNINFDCSNGAVCNNSECSDNNKECTKNTDCSSEFCDGFDAGNLAANPPIPATNGHCRVKRCDPNSQCNPKELLQCPMGDYIIKTQDINDCMKQCNDEDISYIVDVNEKCKNGTEPINQSGSLLSISAGVCRIDKYCISGIKIRESCGNNDDCSDSDGKCISKNITQTVNDPTKFLYKEITGEGWDVAGSIRTSASSYAPQIQAVNAENCDVLKNWCPGGKENKFTVNDKLTNITTTEKSFSAVIKFYAWADKDQMPIRQIAIDWGDGGTILKTEGLIKNHKPACKGSDFGDSPQACDKTYFQYSHIYNCNKENGCSYTPKISVKDNWGWCTKKIYAGDGGDCPEGGFISGPTIKMTK